MSSSLMREHGRVDEKDDLLTLRMNLVSSFEPFWTRLRELFVEKGIDPAKCVFDIWTEDGDLEEGWVVTPDERVFGFDLRYGGGDLTSGTATATFTRWEELTAHPEDWYTKERVELALDIVRSG